jgi:PAS domain-containing protein
MEFRGKTLCSAMKPLKDSDQSAQTILDEGDGSEANLRRIIDTIPALVACFSKDGSNEFFNKKWYDYTGLSPEQSQNDGWQKPVHLDDLLPDACPNPNRDDSATFRRILRARLEPSAVR